MEKTPTILKSRQSLRTPKTASKKLDGVPKMDDDEMSGKILSLRRVKFDMSSGVSPKLASFATPGRTTRSMLKITSNELPSYVTPLKSSKRKTIAATKSSVVRSDDAEMDDGDSNDAFLRPLPPKSKRLDKFQADKPIVDETPTISESTDMPSTNEVKKGRKRSRNAANGAISEINSSQSEVATGKRASRQTKRAKDVAAESSEEDWPSVSILGSTETSSGQFVRSRKSLQENGDANQTSDEDFASVSQLGLNTTGKFVRSRNSKQDFVDNVATSEDDLPSISFLGARVTPVGKSVQRRRTILNIEPTVSNETVPETVSEAVEKTDAKPTPNKRTSLSARKRKSIQGVEVAVGWNTSIDRPKPSRMSGQFVRSRKSELSDIGNEMVMDTEDGLKDQNANDHEENGSAKIDPIDKMVAVEGSQKVPSIEITVDKIDVNELNNVERDSKENIQKVFENSRVSVIDLTDSPLAMVANKSVLNETFSSEKVEEKEEEGEEQKAETEGKYRTFTEEINETAVNDKTFSPIPIWEKKVMKKAAITPAAKKGRASLNAVAKSTGKKNSTVLKRLQSTPYLKPKTRNNLAEPAKLSSAKKAKIVEATMELVEPLKQKSMDRLKVPKVAIQSPKVFKFGDENNQSGAFRFSMCATHLTNKLETGKSAVKKAPNFTNMHNRMFNKTESIAENINRHDQRAKLLLSGKKPTQAPAQGKINFDQKKMKLKSAMAFFLTDFFF